MTPRVASLTCTFPRGFSSDACDVWVSQKALDKPVISDGRQFFSSVHKKKHGLIKILGFILGYHLKIAVRQLFGGGEMIQDAQNPIM